MSVVRIAGPEVVAEARALPVRGVGDNVLVFCECADGRAPIAYLVDRNRLTEAQWERVKAQAEEWAKELSRTPCELRII